MNWDASTWSAVAAVVSAIAAVGSIIAAAASWRVALTAKDAAVRSADVAEQAYGLAQTQTALAAASVTVAKRETLAEIVGQLEAARRELFDLWRDSPWLQEQIDRGALPESVQSSLDPFRDNVIKLLRLHAGALRVVLADHPADEKAVIGMLSYLEEVLRASTKTWQLGRFYETYLGKDYDRFSYGEKLPKLLDDAYKLLGKHLDDYQLRLGEVQRRLLQSNPEALERVAR